MRACACVPWPPCGGQRTVCGSWFSISTMWVDFEVKLIRETYTTTKTKTKKQKTKKTKTKHLSLIPVLSKPKTSLWEFKACWVYIARVPGMLHRETLSPKDRNKMNNNSNKH